jgi:phosphate transport system permease protein
MTDRKTPATMAAPTNWKSQEMKNLIVKRYASERRFHFLGRAAVIFAGSFLLFLLFTIFSQGLSGFMRSEIQLDVTYAEATLGVTRADALATGGKDRLEQADYGLLGGDSLLKQFPTLTDTNDQDRVFAMLSQGTSSVIKKQLLDNPALLGKTAKIWVPLSSDFDLLNRGQIDRAIAETDRGISDASIALFDKVKSSGNVRTSFNMTFLTGGDSRDPELAAVMGATVGSLLTLLVTLLASFPIGLLAAIYLEEFAPKNKFTDFIEVNINNLAAVPSIIYGLLGLAVFLGTFGMARSAPLVGGLTLALMTLPTIVIASRVSIKAVPPSIRDGARGIGASPLQVVLHHVLPLALPGIMTGSIIGMARALGETAPLLMVGMRAFVADVPNSITDPATVLPVQVFLWSDSVEKGFIEKTSAAIIVLLIVLILMNAVAVYLRNRFEKRW